MCPSCGNAVTGDPPRCAVCGGLFGRGDDATMEVPGTPSAIDMVAAGRSEQLRHQVALGPGESALVITRGPGAGSSFRLGQEMVTLGRNPTATVLLDDISVSRCHAEIHPVPGGYRIVDVGSLNGTYVNGVRVDEAGLERGDDVQIGLFRLRFVTKGSPGTASIRPASGGR